MFRTLWRLRFFPTYFLAGVTLAMVYDPHPNIVHIQMAVACFGPTLLFAAAISGLEALRTTRYYNKKLGEITVQEEQLKDDPDYQAARAGLRHYIEYVCRTTTEPPGDT